MNPLELEQLKKKLEDIADKVTKDFNENSTVENAIQREIYDSITIISAQVAAKVIYEYEKSRKENE